MMDRPQNVPSLPGHAPTPAPSKAQTRGHHFAVIQNVRCENAPFNGVLPPAYKTPTDSLSESLMRFQQIDQQLKDLAKQRAQAEFPHLACQRKENLIEGMPTQVLRFYAYFTEPVLISRIENEIRRTVIIYFYVADQTVQIVEPKIKNSGLAQGDFLKRQRVVSPLGEWLKENDFMVGQRVIVFGREFTVYDADASTREYYLQRGCPQLPKIELPVDQFTTYMKFSERGSETRRVERLNAPQSDDADYQKFKMEKYLKFDKMILSFDAVWLDTCQAQRIKINYILADDMVEVYEVMSNGPSKNAMPIFLRKGRLPKAVVLTHCPGMSHTPIEYYGPRDFVIPSVINVYGREARLVGCDPFTKEYFVREFGIQQTEYVAASAQDSTIKTARVIPPYNGFGSEEDTLMNCQSIIPKPPKIDFHNWVKNSGVVLRFVCRLVSEDENNRYKRFLLSYYLENNTLMVYLITERNSGIPQGKFLERGPYKNPANGGANFGINDFEIGRILEVNRYKLQILTADDFTMRFLVASPDSMVGDKMAAVRAKLRDTYSGVLAKHKDRLTGGSHWVDFDAFQGWLKDAGIPLNLDEAFYAFFSGEKNEKAELNLADFCDKIGTKN